MPNITVVDALMGEGKTSHVFDMMRSQSDENFIYIGVTLDESDRCIAECPDLQLRNPVPRHGRKYFDLLKLVEQNANVSSTHQLFRHMTGELYERLKGKGYVLIIDECLDVVSQYKIHPDTLRLLEEAGALYVDGRHCLRWNHERAPDYARKKGHHDLSELIALCDNGNLVKTRNGILIWQFPASFLDVFKEVYICTYMFEGQVMADYLKANGVQYELATLHDGQLVPYHSVDNTELKRQLARLISLDMDPYRNALGVQQSNRFPLSKQWFAARTKGNASLKLKNELKRVRNSTAAFFRQFGAKGSEGNMWTCFKEHRSKLKGPRYATLTSKRKTDRKINFVPMNAKATDEFKHKQALAYLVDRHQSPIVAGYFQDMGIPIREDLFALTELIQWIWRSRIRNNPPEPIQLYLPSERMRTTLTNWIKYSDAEIVAGQRLDVAPNEAEPLKQAA